MGIYKVYTDLSGQKFGQLTVIRFSHWNEYKSGRHSCWLCECDCGNVATPLGCNLKSGKSNSCGCSRKETEEAILREIVHHYKKHAVGRGFEFHISENKCFSLFAKNCFYCGEPPSNTKTRFSSKTQVKYSGIDRVDNARGYEDDNVVPCCASCNRAKHALTQNQFLTMCHRVAQRHTFAEAA